jgi:hypothetical protein
MEFQIIYVVLKERIHGFLLANFNRRKNLQIFKLAHFQITFKLTLCADSWPTKAPR